MKKKNLVLLMMVAVCMLSATSCGEDEKDKEESSSVVEAKESKSSGKNAKVSKEKKTVTTEFLEGIYDFRESVYRKPKQVEEGWYKLYRLFDPDGKVVANTYLYEKCFGAYKADYDIRTAIIEFDSRGNKIYYNERGGDFGEQRNEYDNDNNLIEQTFFSYRKVTGKHRYDANGKLIYEQSGDNVKKWDSEGNLIYDSGVSYRYEYDSRGNLIVQEIPHEYFPYKLIIEWEYEYDDNGHPLHIKNCEKQGDSIVTLKETWNEYDIKGNLIYQKKEDEFDLIYNERSISGWEEWFEYDDKSNIIYKKVASGKFTYYKDGYYEKNKTLLYRNDAISRIQESKKRFFEDWYEYDKDGNLIHEKSSSGWESEWRYDDRGNLIYKKEGSSENFWEYEYEYDSNGVLLHEKCCRNGEVDWENFWEYNSNGILLHHNSDWYSNGVGIYIEGLRKVEYDPNGTAIRYCYSGTEWMEKSNAKGEKLKHWVSNDRQEEWYDSKGILVGRKTADGKKTFFDYEYYKNGKVKAIYFMQP